MQMVGPLETYQRISHPLTPPFTMEEIAERAGASLQVLAARHEFARLQVKYEERTATCPVLTVRPEAFQFEMP